MPLVDKVGFRCYYSDNFEYASLNKIVQGIFLVITVGGKSFLITFSTFSLLPIEN
jgi:hypothetical protein